MHVQVHPPFPLHDEWTPRPPRCVIDGCCCCCKHRHPFPVLPQNLTLATITTTIIDSPTESHRPWDADDALVFTPPETYLLDPQQGRLRR
jgi:hypothetical protein